MQAGGREIGAEIDDVLDAKREEFSVGVKRQFDMREIVARVMIGEEALAALALPFDRTAEMFRRPQNEAELGMRIAFQPERAADIRRDDAKFVFWKLEDASRQFAARVCGDWVAA